MQRRQFFHWCSLALSALTTAFLAVPGLSFLADPLSRGGKKGKRHRLIKLDDLPVGEPRKLVITDRRVDAWTKHPEGPVGAVWLTRQDDDTVIAFSTTCPHLGCMVNYMAADENYFCPCHEGRFAGDGSIVSGPQQRGLDTLEVVVEGQGGEAWVSVVLEQFETGIAEKVTRG